MMLRRRDLLQVAGATVILAALPRPARASAALDAYYVSAFDRIVAPVCTNLVRPATRERDDISPFWFTKFDLVAWRSVVSYARRATVPQTDYEAIHESGHAFAVLLDQWHPGNWRRSFLSYHGAAIDETDDRLNEIFAEHFAAALGMPLYLGYPAYRGVVPFRSAADTRAWIVAANEISGVWAMARMEPRVVAISVDENGDTVREGVLVAVSGLKPGVPSQPTIMRVGFTSDGGDIGTFVFATDTDSQAWGRIHARGAKGGGTVYVTVSAFQ